MAKAAFDVIDEEVNSWPGITAVTGSRGEHSFRLGKREIGHLHGSRVAHFGFPKKVWHELFADGRITYHPVFPDRPGFGARAIESDEDVDDVIALLRLNYDRGIAKHGVPGADG